MEKLKVPQTHLGMFLLMKFYFFQFQNLSDFKKGLKQMIKDIDEDEDGKINFKEVRFTRIQRLGMINNRFVSYQFLMIFRKAINGDLKEDSGLKQLYSQIMEIDVGKEGVKGAKSFFEAQVNL